MSIHIGTSAASITNDFAPLVCPGHPTDSKDATVPMQPRKSPYIRDRGFKTGPEQAVIDKVNQTNFKLPVLKTNKDSFHI
jgi:hypothetical protein